MPISPRTMSFGAPQASADQARPLFEQGLTQMAYDVLIAKLPQVSPDVVTFKIIDVDPEAGSGSGTFIVRRQGQTLYVPVVMADNQIKPLDLMYHKSLNVFLPLNKDWLDQVEKSGLAEMGAGATAPKSLSKDVDIRQVVVPPVTGRFSYASDESAVKTAAEVFGQARVTKSPGRPVFLEYLSLAPNRVKKAAAMVFEQNPRVLKAAVRTYGGSRLTAALRPSVEKVADFGGRLSRSGGLYVADENTPSDVFKDVFGPQAPMAYQEAVTTGFAAKDDRPGKKRAMKITTTISLTQPTEPGAYKFVRASGEPVVALAFPAVTKLIGRRKYDARHSTQTRGYEEPRFTDQYAITADGELVKGHLPIGERLNLGELKGTQLMAALQKGEPRVGATGMFVKLDAHGLTATEPVKVKTVSTDSDGVRHVVVTAHPYGYEERELLTSTRSRTPLMIPGTERIGYLPADYKFVSFDESAEVKSLVHDSRHVYKIVEEQLVKESAEKHVVRHSGSNGWTVGEGNRTGLKFAQAVDALARKSGVDAHVAATLVKEAAESGRAEFWSVPERGARNVERFLKVAAGPAQPPAQDPAMMDPSMMAPPAPPMPTPVDMAVAEQTQSIMGQMQALQQQLAMLQMVQQRSQQIAGGGGAAAAPEAAAAAMGGPQPMGPQGVNPMLAGPGPQGMQPGMDPYAQQGMQPGMDPNAQQGMQPGMDPNAQQGMQPGMDPNAQQQIDPQTGQPIQPPPAMMATDPGTPEEIAAQVNPQFMEQAGALQDEGAFDAAALSSMAQAPAVRDLVSTYVPNLERALDNLGRVLLTVYLDESRIKSDVGNETFLALEDNLRNTFKGLGDLLLKINQNATVMQPTYQTGL